jgi:hypothetical protein
MAITTAMCTSFKSELLGGIHDLDTNTLKLALIKASPSGTYGAATTNYSDVTGNSDEATGAKTSSVKSKKAVVPDVAIAAPSKF